MGIEGRLKGIKGWLQDLTYRLIAAVPLIAGEMAVFVGLHKGDGFYVAAGTLSVAGCVIHWARRPSKKEVYASLDTLFEYYPLPSITIPATIISSLVTLEMLTEIYSRSNGAL